MPTHQLPHFRPIGGNQPRFIPTPLGHRNGTEHPRGHSPRKLRPRHPHAGRNESRKQQRDHSDKPDPLHSPLSALPHAPSRPQGANLSPLRKGLSRNYNWPISAAISEAAALASAKSIEVFGS